MAAAAAAAAAPTPARLTYFAGWGLAEQTRWVLAATSTKFEQIALESHAEFEALRASGALLFNQLPLLEIDGLCLTQSQAMLRYVARTRGLEGRTPAEQALNDMLCEGVRDARGVVTGFPFAENPEAYRAQAPARLVRHLPFFEAALADGGFAIASHELTTADVLLAELIEGATPLVPAAFWRAYPKVRSLHRRVVSLPSLREYLTSDRRYPFPEGEIGSAYVHNVSQVLGR